MGAKICSLCQDNLALEPARQLALFGATYPDENGEHPCLECIQEALSETREE